MGKNWGRRTGETGEGAGCATGGGVGLLPCQQQSTAIYLHADTKQCGMLDTCLSTNVFCLAKADLQSP